MKTSFGLMDEQKYSTGSLWMKVGMKAGFWVLAPQVRWCLCCEGFEFDWEHSILIFVRCKEPTDLVQMQRACAGILRGSAKFISGNGGQNAVENAVKRIAGTRTLADVAAGDEKIVAAVIVERLPVVLPQISPPAEAFESFSYVFHLQDLFVLHHEPLNSCINPKFTLLQITLNYNISELIHIKRRVATSNLCAVHHRSLIYTSTLISHHTTLPLNWCFPNIGYKF